VQGFRKFLPASEREEALFIDGGCRVLECISAVSLSILISIPSARSPFTEACTLLDIFSHFIIVEPPVHLIAFLPRMLSFSDSNSVLSYFKFPAFESFGILVYKSTSLQRRNILEGIKLQYKSAPRALLDVTPLSGRLSLF
jgi:hypothetical protein